MDLTEMHKNALQFYRLHDFCGYCKVLQSTASKYFNGEQIFNNKGIKDIV